MADPSNNGRVPDHLARATQDEWWEGEPEYHQDNDNFCIAEKALLGLLFLIVTYSTVACIKLTYDLISLIF